MIDTAVMGYLSHTDGKNLKGILHNKTVNGTYLSRREKITGDIVDMNPVEGKAAVTYNDGRRETTQLLNQNQ